MKGGGVIPLHGPPVGIGFHIFIGVRLTPSHKSAHERTVYWIGTHSDPKGNRTLIALRRGNYVPLDRFTGKWFLIAMPYEHEGETWTDGN